MRCSTTNFASGSDFIVPPHFDERIPDEEDEELPLPPASLPLVL